MFFCFCFCAAAVATRVGIFFFVFLWWSFAQVAVMAVYLSGRRLGIFVAWQKNIGVSCEEGNVVVCACDARLKSFIVEWTRQQQHTFL